MDDMNRFREMLMDILEVAKVQDNRLTMEEIKALLGDIELSEIHYEHIFAYLAANHIKIEGYIESVSQYTKDIAEEAKQAELREKQAEDAKQEEEVEWAKQEERAEDTNESSSETYTSKDDNKEQIDDRYETTVQKHNFKQEKEDSIYLKMYLEDLTAIEIITPEEEIKLIDRIRIGDSNAKNRFTESYLHEVVQIADEYRNRGVGLEDIIQEGNIGFLSCLAHLSELSDKTTWKEFAADYVRQSIESFIHEQLDTSNFNHKMIEKIKYINESANTLAEDLGKNADIYELAAYTKLSVQEIQDVLNMSVDTVNLGEHNHGARGH